MLTVGNFYRVALQQPRTEQYDIQIIGTTTISEKNYFLNFDIQGSFFTAYNLGLASYLSAVANDAPIYICLRVTSRSPITLESTPSLLIPANIVDEKNSISLVESSDFSINISGLTLALDPIPKQQYCNQMQVDLANALKNVAELTGYPISINYTSIQSLYDQGYIDALIVSNIAAQNGQEAMFQQAREDYEFKNNLLTEKFLELNQKITQYNSYIDSLNSIMNDLAVKQNTVISQMQDVS